MSDIFEESSVTAVFKATLFTAGLILKCCLFVVSFLWQILSPYVTILVRPVYLKTTSKLSGALNSIVQICIFQWRRTVYSLKSGCQLVQSHICSILLSIKLFWVTLFCNIRNVIVSVIFLPYTVYRIIKEAVVNTRRRIVSAITQSVKHVITIVYNFFANIFRCISDFVLHVRDAIQGLIYFIINSVCQFVYTIYSTIYQIFYSLYLAIYNLFYHIFYAIYAFCKGIYDAVFTVINAIYSLVINVANSIARAVKLVVNGCLYSARLSKAAVWAAYDRFVRIVNGFRDGSITVYRLTRSLGNGVVLTWRSCTSHISCGISRSVHGLLYVVRHPLKAGETTLNATVHSLMWLTTNLLIRTTLTIKWGCATTASGLKQARSICSRKTRDLSWLLLSKASAHKTHAACVTLLFALVIAPALYLSAEMYLLGGNVDHYWNSYLLYLNIYATLTSRVSVWLWESLLYWLGIFTSIVLKTLNSVYVLATFILYVAAETWQLCSQLLTDTLLVLSGCVHSALYLFEKYTTYKETLFVLIVLGISYYCNVLLHELSQDDSGAMCRSQTDSLVGSSELEFDTESETSDDERSFYPDADDTISPHMTDSFTLG